MFVLRLVISLSLVSFLLNGGEIHPVNTAITDYPSPAHASAAKVVAALSETRHLCEDAPLVCDVGEGAGRFAGAWGEALLASAAKALKDQAAEQERENEAAASTE